MARIKGNELGKELCEAIGIGPDNVHSITLQCTAGEIAMLLVQRYIDSVEFEAVKNILERYEIKLKQDGF